MRGERGQRGEHRRRRVRRAEEDDAPRDRGRGLAGRERLEERAVHARVRDVPGLAGDVADERPPQGGLPPLIVEDAAARAVPVDEQILPRLPRVEPVGPIRLVLLELGRELPRELEPASALQFVGRLVAGVEAPGPAQALRRRGIARHPVGLPHAGRRRTIVPLY